ncbi:MAG: penicillin acylase family protein [Caldilineales bacterium]|nr:penicillin acylase family protein [Caldilineales bacterium]MDW8318299.1 penicillin acylase family protein [Anaerolineae bacterium]
MLRKILKILLIALLVLVVAAMVGAVLFVRSPLPKTAGALNVAGVRAPVTVYRDRYGVPHIFAENEHDLFFAQGYVTAQDRLFQMDFQRRAGAGRLSEVLGEATLDNDRFLRTIGMYRAAQKDLEAISPDTLVYLQAYADGVNAFIAQAGDDLPLEFRILGYRPEPWQPLDSIVWGKLMAYQLGGNYEIELFRAQLIDLLGPEKAADLLPRYPQTGPFIVPPEVKRYGGLRGLDLAAAAKLRRFLRADGDGLGSNNWVIAGSRTTTGKPLLANDPHLGLQIPSVWYQVGLHGGRFNVVGFTFAGVPGIILGHNDRIAWGVTNVGPDVQDLYIEKVNPDNPNQVEFMGKWEDVQVIEEVIRVAGRAEPVVETVRITRHGPIMNAVLGDEMAQAEPVALRWTALDGGALWQAFMLLNQARNWEDFRNALRYFDVPSQNFVYADVDGNIGYQMPGRIPIRAKGDGTVPVPGWTGEYEWIGFIPFEELPSVFNPAVGYIATANNQVVPDTYPYLIGTSWSARYRAQRIVDLINSKDKLSVEDMKAIQGDIRPVTTDIFVPLLDGVTSEDPAVAKALELMRGWDRQMHADRPEPLIYHMFLQRLFHRTLGDEMAAAGDAEMIEEYLKEFRDEPTQLLEQLAQDPTNPWWNDVGTPETETRDQIVAAAFTEAVAELQKSTEAKDPARWRWGEAHYANFDHLIFAAVDPLNRLFNRRVPARGEAFTVNAASQAYPSFVMNSGVSFRSVMDLSDLSAAHMIHTTGQSGQLFSPHYDDMIEAWQNVEYHTMLFNRADIEKAAKDVLVLRP